MFKSKMNNRKFGTIRNQKGQSMVEYLLMLAVIAFMFILAKQLFTKFGIADKVMGADTLLAPLEFTYRYGDKRTRGWDEGPNEHPIIDQPGNYKLFTEGEK